MKVIGEWVVSSVDGDNITFNLANEMGTASLSVDPVVTGVDCTATLVSKTAGGKVVVKVTNGVYAGAVQIKATLSDGRDLGREVRLRFV